MGIAHGGECDEMLRPSRKLKAKPAALAARKLSGVTLSDQLKNGGETIRLIAQLESGAAAIAASGTGDPDPPNGARARALIAETPTEHAVLQAKLERALELIEVLEPQCGGFAKPDVQAAIFEARAMLVEAGRREPEARTPWVDRTPAPRRRLGCLDLDSQWPGPDGKPRGPTLCVSYPKCRCGRIDTGKAIPEDDVG